MDTEYVAAVAGSVAIAKLRAATPTLASSLALRAQATLTTPTCALRPISNPLNYALNAIDADIIGKVADSDDKRMKELMKSASKFVVMTA